MVNEIRSETCTRRLSLKDDFVMNRDLDVEPVLMWCPLLGLVRARMIVTYGYWRSFRNVKLLDQCGRRILKL